MVSVPDTPTRSEWLALIQQDPALARQHMISLKVRIKRQGLFADPALSISVETYDEAQDLLAKAAGDERQAQQVAYLTRLGQATLGPTQIARTGWR